MDKDPKDHRAAGLNEAYQQGKAKREADEQRRMNDVRKWQADAYHTLRPYHLTEDGRRVDLPYELARRTDAFDRMIRAAIARNTTCGLHIGHINTGRHYRTVIELVQSTSARSCLDLSPGGGGGVADVGGAILDARRWVATYQRRIGEGMALEVRRRTARPRHPITRRDLVDLVCLGDLQPSAIAIRHGWVKSNGKAQDHAVQHLTRALAAALDAMMGPVRHGPTHTRTDLPPDWQRYGRKERPSGAKKPS